MAQPLSTIGFNSGQSEKQSAENCINYIPFPTTANDLNGGQVSLYSTTGIDGPNPSSTGLINDGLGHLYSEIYQFNGLQGGIGGSAWAYWNERLIQFSGSQSTVFSISGLTSSSSSQAARFSSNSDTLVVVGTTQGGSSFCQKLDGANGLITPVDISPLSGSLSPGQNESVFLADTAYFGDRWLYLSSAPAFDDNYKRVYFSKVADPDVDNANSFIGTTEDIGEYRGLHVLSGRLYVFSERQVSVFNKNNSNTIPFVEQQGSRLDYGLISASCKAELNGSVYFIGNSQGRIQLLRISGGSIQKISTPAIDDILNDGDWWNRVNYFSYLSRVFAFVDAGRSYVAFTFNGKTICYDPESGLFHNRSSELNANGQQWDIAGSALASGFPLGNGEGASLMVGMRIIREVNNQNRMLFNAGRVNKNIGTEFGQLVERTAISAPYNSNGVTNNLREIQAISDIDNDPLDDNWPEPNINLSTSKDYGYSFGPEKSRQFGEQGVRNRLLRWLNLGMFRQAFVIKLRTKHPYAHQIVKVLAQIEKGFRQR